MTKDAPAEPRSFSKWLRATPIESPHIALACEVEDLALVGWTPEALKDAMGERWADDIDAAWQDWRSVARPTKESDDGNQQRHPPASTGAG